MYSNSIDHYNLTYLYLNSLPPPIDKPIPPPRKASADVQFGYLYGTVNLTCEAEAEPAADFTWYRQNKKLNPKVHLIHSEGHESILQVGSICFLFPFFCRAAINIFSVADCRQRYESFR